VFQERDGSGALAVDGVADNWVSPGGLQDLALVSEATGLGDIYAGVISPLALVHSVFILGPTYVEAKSGLHFVSDEWDHVGTVVCGATDTLVLLGTAGRTVSVSVTSTMSLSIIGERSLSAGSVMTLSSIVSAGKAGEATSTLELVQEAAPGLVLNFDISDDLGVEQATTFYLDTTRRFDRQYYPFVGDGALTSPTPPSTTLSGPMEGITAPFQLVYPAVGDVTDSVTLRAPNLGNKDRLGFQRINRETRGGTLVVFADPTWPKTQTLALTFSGMTQSEAQDYLDFISDHFGEEIGLIDWESRYWRGVVMTPSDPVTEDSANYFSFSFEFEGELVTWLPQVIPVAPGTPLRRIKPTQGETPDPMEPVPPVEPTTETYSAEVDESVLVGQPIYIKGTSHVAPAKADSATTSRVGGFAITAADPGNAADYVTEGKLTITDWTAVTGSASLTPGSAYYLDASVAGRITSGVPVATGEYVVYVGRATSTLTLDIEIAPSIRL